MSYSIDDLNLIYAPLRNGTIINRIRPTMWRFTYDSVENQEKASTLINIKHSVPIPGVIEFSGINLVDFLSKFYDDPRAVYPFYSPVYGDYLKLLDQPHVPRCLFFRESGAIRPSKNFASDEGYDLTLIKVDKVISDNIIRYDTGIRVRPPLGYHIEVLPRSSLSNTGWMMSNSVGLIDASYSGTLKVCLSRVVPEAKGISLPFKGAQMVLRKSNHYLFDEVEKFDEETTRGDGGFGSTNKEPVKN